MRICVVDDEPYFVELFSEAIAGLGDIDLDIARSAKEAQSICEERRRSFENISDVVFFVDIRMEKSESGFDFLRYLKSDRYYKTAPVVMISSSVKQRHIDASFALGAASFVSKGASARSTHAAFRDAVKYWMFITRRPLLNDQMFLESQSSSDDTIVNDPKARKEDPTLIETIVARLFQAVIDDVSRLEGLERQEVEAISAFKSLFWKTREIFEFNEEFISKRAQSEIGRFYNIVDNWLANIEGGNLHKNSQLSVVSEAKRSRNRIRSALIRYRRGDVVEKNLVIDMLWRHLSPVVFEYRQYFLKTSSILIRLRDRFLT